MKGTHEQENVGNRYSRMNAEILLILMTLLIPFRLPLLHGGYEVYQWTFSLSGVLHCIILMWST